MKVRYIGTNEVFEVYGVREDVRTYEMYSFLIYRDGRWRWVSCNSFVPVEDKGKWVVDFDCGSTVLSCSLCNEKYWVDASSESEEYRPNFCPRCGVQMEEDG